MRCSVSVIIPCFDSEATLSEAIESALAQTLPGVEVVAVDDGSSDGTRALLEEYAHRHPDRVRVLNQAHQGPYVARNAAARVSRGTFLAFLDADDVWEPDKLSTQVELMEGHPAVVLCHTGGITIRADGSPVSSFRARDGYEGDCFARMVVANGIATSSVLVPRRLFDQMGGFDERFGARGDWELWTRFARRGPFAALARPLFRYRLHDGRMSRDTDRMRRLHFRVIEKHREVHRGSVPGFSRLVHESRWEAHMAYGSEYLGAGRRFRGLAEAAHAIRLHPFRARSWKLLGRGILGRRRSRTRRARRPAWRRLDRELRGRFAEGDSSGTHAAERLEWLAGYLVLGFLAHRLPAPSLAAYPGAPSTNGRGFDRMEGFTRTAPLLAAWIHGGRPEAMRLPDGSTARPLALLAAGLAAGTDPSSAGYWGPVRERSQAVVEAADVALAAWLAHDVLPGAMGGDAWNRLLGWLRGGIAREVADNNWHLFPVVVHRVLADLGAPDLPDTVADAHYRRFKEFHLGAGWFQDGPKGAVDYYNAWQMHYVLYWLGRIDPSFDRAFRTRIRDEFVERYRYLIGPEGFPVLGRSICYRMAAPSPLVASALEGSGAVEPGAARRALDRTWAHFIQRGAVARGTITQGYGRSDLRFLDNYSGPASPLWSTRSLVLAFSVPRDHRFWTVPESPLPVEQGSYRVEIPEVGWEVRGDAGSTTIVVDRGANGSSRAAAQIEGYPPWRRTLDRWRGRPGRPENLQAKFGLSRYASREPFCGYGPGRGRGPR